MDSALSNEYDRTMELKEFDESKMGVKGLSDSGITSIPRIFVHSPESLSDLKISSDPEGISIPLIDLSGVNSPSDREKILQQVKQASKTWGFFQVINHGIPITVMDDTISSINAFYDLPQDVRSTYYSRELQPRTATLVSNIDLFSSSAASWFDTLRWRVGGVEIPEICRKETLEWISRTTVVAESLMELFSEGLGLDRNKLKEMSFCQSKYFTGHCYPYCPEPDRTVGITSHTDGVVMTVVMMNHVPGLQVKYGDLWVDVNPMSGSLIINIGDFLQIASNDEYTSVQHRVLANSLKEPRISVSVFFGVENWNDNDFGPLPELLSPENPAKYHNFSREEYLKVYQNTPVGIKTLVERVKI